MAWNKADITTDITSQLHSTGGAKANTLQHGTDNLQESAMKSKVKSRATTSEVLKQNDENARQNAIAPPQNPSGPGPSSTARKSTDEDRVQLSADVRDMTYVSRQADSPVNKGPKEMVLEKKMEKKSGPMSEVYENREKPSEKAEQLHKILSGETPAKMSAAEESKSNMFGGYGQDVELVAEVDQDHPTNPTSPTARAESAEEAQAENKPSAVESEVGQSLDKLI